MKGLDTLSPVTKFLPCFQQKGIQFVARYLRNFKLAEVKAICDAGMQIVSIAERGNPTKASYFTRARGLADGSWAVALAQSLGQPVGSAIYFTVDCDVSAKDLQGGITEYFRGVQFSLAETGYKVGGYGPGLVLTHLLSQHLIRYSWLANARGWQGYKAFKGGDIRQGAETKLCGVGIDPDEGFGDFGAWTLGAQAAPAVPSSMVAQTLKLGSKGDNVKTLQEALGIPSDGIFGKGTENALKTFQMAHKLTTDGIAGPMTRAALKI